MRRDGETKIITDTITFLKDWEKGYCKFHNKWQFELFVAEQSCYLKNCLSYSDKY